MRRLGLLRHAKSSWEDPRLADFDRPLKKRGVRAARRMGEELSRAGVAFDAVFASPARRVVETISCFEQGYGEPLGARFEPRLYESSPVSLWQAMQSASDEAKRLLIVAHQPALQTFAALLCSKEQPLYGPLTDNFPTAAFVLIEFDSDRWAEIEPGTGRILLLLKPRELD